MSTPPKRVWCPPTIQAHLAHVCGVALQSARIQELEERCTEAVDNAAVAAFRCTQLNATINKWMQQIEELAFKYISLCKMCMELHETDKGFSCETCHEFLCAKDTIRCDECGKIMCASCTYHCDDEDCFKRLCPACDTLRNADGVGVFCRAHQKE